MRPMIAGWAIGGACAACCAFPVAAGLGIFAAAGGAAYLGGIAGGAIVLGLAASGWYLLRRRRRAMPSTALPASACGCAGPALPAPEQDAASDVIACTLMAEDFRSRTAWIRDLARRHLKAATRSPLSLHLVYRPEAAGDIREMLRREPECCAFLRFELRVADDGFIFSSPPPKRRGRRPTCCSIISRRISRIRKPPERKERGHGPLTPHAGGSGPHAGDARRCRGQAIARGRRG